MTIRTLIISTFIHWAPCLMKPGMQWRMELAAASIAFHATAADPVGKQTRADLRARFVPSTASGEYLDSRMSAGNVTAQSKKCAMRLPADMSHETHT